jgi:hypothetical protein
MRRVAGPVSTTMSLSRDKDVVCGCKVSRVELQSKPIDFPELGIVTFQTIQSTASQLTAITHQISFDGMQYVAIHPGQQIDLGGKRFWFRSLMERLDGNFDQISQPIDSPGQDPGLSDYYRVNNVASFDLGNGILERTIALNLLVKDPPDGLDRIVPLREDPLPGTVTVYQDTALLGPQEYTLRGDACMSVATRNAYTKLAVFSTLSRVFKISRNRRGNPGNSMRPTSGRVACVSVWPWLAFGGAAYGQVADCTIDIGQKGKKLRGEGVVGLMGG